MAWVDSLLPSSTASAPASPLILASGSPRRRELLAGLGLAFRVVVSDVDETSSETDPARLAADLSRLKAEAVAAQHPDATVIGSDTVVALESGPAARLLGKPADAAENAAFLRALAGQTHSVWTGVTVVHQGQAQTAAERTDVTFRPLTDAEIAYYAASGEGLDKAGGYGIQGLGMALISRIEGEYSNVVGFPLSRVIALLRGAGLTVWGQGPPASPGTPSP